MADEDSPIWSCKVCIDQFFGGPRCYQHNPTPEMREAHPERFPRTRLARPERPGRSRASRKEFFA